jgi:hypothetical protein
LGLTKRFQITQVIIAQTLAGCACGISGTFRLRFKIECERADNSSVGTMFAVPSEVMPSRYRAHVQTGMSWFSGLASVPALVGMGKIRALTETLSFCLYPFSPGAAINADPINGWKWVFRTQLITNGIIAVGFFLLYHVSKYLRVCDAKLIVSCITAPSANSDNHLVQQAGCNSGLDRLLPALRWSCSALDGICVGQ